jgi:copper homeostasis protein
MKIELCVASVEALLAAKSLGVDRIELCVNLEQGGLTPSLGFVQKAKDLGIETHVLIRPRSGGFVYNEHEIEIILADVLEFQRLNVDGLVLGMLTDTMRLNRPVLERIRSNFNKSLTFHRAFDDLVEWKQELQWLADTGYNRVLSSGLSTTIAHGIPVLASMKQEAKGRIEIMPGGGINLANLPQIMEHVLPDAVHFSATGKQSLDPDSMFSEEVLIFDEHKAKRLIEMCRNFS